MNEAIATVALEMQTATDTAKAAGPSVGDLTKVVDGLERATAAAIVAVQAAQSVPPPDQKIRAPAQLMPPTPVLVVPPVPPLEPSAKPHGPLPTESASEWSEQSWQPTPPLALHAEPLEEPTTQTAMPRPAPPTEAPPQPSLNLLQNAFAPDWKPLPEPPPKFPLQLPPSYIRLPPLIMPPLLSECLPRIPGETQLADVLPKPEKTGPLPKKKKPKLAPRVRAAALYTPKPRKPIKLTQAPRPPTPPPEPEPIIWPEPPEPEPSEFVPKKKRLYTVYSADGELFYDGSKGDFKSIWTEPMPKPKQFVPEPFLSPRAPAQLQADTSEPAPPEPRSILEEPAKIDKLIDRVAQLGETLQTLTQQQKEVIDGVGLPPLKKPEITQPWLQPWQKAYQQPWQDEETYKSSRAPDKAPQNLRVLRAREREAVRTMAMLEAGIREEASTLPRRPATTGASVTPIMTTSASLPAIVRPPGASPPSGGAGTSSSGAGPSNASPRTARVGARRRASLPYLEV